jgi:putative transcriptional regulator
LGRSRLSKLSINPNTRVTAEELYKIALAIQEDPGEMFRELFAGLSLAEFPEHDV